MDDLIHKKMNDYETLTELRKQTNKPMMECRDILSRAGGNLEKAINIATQKSEYVGVLTSNVGQIHINGLTSLGRVTQEEIDNPNVQVAIKTGAVTLEEYDEEKWNENLDDEEHTDIQLSTEVRCPHCMKTFDLPTPTISS